MFSGIPTNNNTHLEGPKPLGVRAHAYKTGLIVTADVKYCITSKPKCNIMHYRKIK